MHGDERVKTSTLARSSMTPRWIGVAGLVYVACGAIASCGLKGEVLVTFAAGLRAGPAAR